MNLSFASVREDKPGDKWKSLFDRTWPLYKTWFLSEGYLERKGYLTSVSEFQKHMPELMPIYEQLVQLAGGGDLEARFLSMYTPPAYMSGCSQVAWTRGTTSLMRNYDYSYKMFEGTMLYSDWLQPVIGFTDCNWGLLDGMNSRGLAASLTFGGRKVSGDGFGIPIIIRYILETSNTVEEGVTILKRVPVHMAYNVTLVDATGKFATVYLSPDRAAIVVDAAVVTNHQVEVEWGDYAMLTETIERKRFLEEAMSSPFETEESMLRHFLYPPLYNTNFAKSFGTLYTVQYKIPTKEIMVLWPEQSMYQSFDFFTEQKISRKIISLNEGLVS